MCVVWNSLEFDCDRNGKETNMKIHIEIIKYLVYAYTYIFHRGDKSNLNTYLLSDRLISFAIQGPYLTLTLLYA